ncbi:MAG: corrinoid protein [Bacillota bacterium]
MSGGLALALADLREQDVLRLVKEGAEAGADPWALVGDLRRGISQVGDRFEKGEYFVSELIMAADIFKQVMVVLEPLLAGKREAPLGRVVMATVKGDIHDIGKNIVSMILSANGFEVFDLGVDVPPERIVSALQETGATVLGLSALLTVSFDPMKETIHALEQARLRDRVKVMIGGGPVNEKVRAYTGADGVGYDAQDAVALARQFLGVK